MGEERQIKVNLTAILLGIMFCSTILFIGLFIWPGMYEYDKMDQKWPVRINRLTGETEVLIPEGWVPLDRLDVQNEKGQTGPVEVPYEEMKKLDLNLIYEAREDNENPNRILYAELNGTLYNGTDRTIRQLIVEVKVYKDDSTVEMTRRYNMTVNVPPYEDMPVEQTIQLDLRNKKYEIKLVGAKWE